MLSIVHSSRVFVSFVCALLIVSAFPTEVRSQDVSESTTTPVVATEATEPPYQIDGIPGGEAVVGDFVVGPGKVDATVVPGESKVVFMTITNRTGERRIFNITVEDAAGTGDLRTPVRLLGESRGPYSLRDYLSIPHLSFELGHNERARVPVTISIPPDAEPGGKYGSVLVDTVALEQKTGDIVETVPQSAIIARIGTLFFVTIPGPVERDAELVEFGTLGKKKIFSEGPITFGILHENRGSIHIAPYGEIRVTNMFGEEVGYVELDPWFILPGSARIREITWDREFLFGKYTARADINRSYNDIIDSGEFTFWVLPWKLLAGGFGVIFVFIFLIRTFFRTFEFKRKG